MDSRKNGVKHRTQRNNPRAARSRPHDRVRSGIETLESRRLLSAAHGCAQPHLALSPAASFSSFSGYSPSQIRHAYGFDQVSGDGSGQTIAIVDAFNDPNIAADLHTFDQKFGLADPPSFNVVSQTGSSVKS